MPGEILGVLGESGSGKSTLAASVLRLLPSNGHIGGGTVLFEGKNLLQVGYQDLRQIRGGRIALISQEPSLALHPTLRVGEQVRQVLAAHQASTRKELAERIRDGKPASPGFDAAVTRHRLLDAIVRASDTGLKQ